MIIKKHEPEIQLLKETVDIYFSVELSKDDERIQKYDLDPEALSIWVSFPNYNATSPLIDLADGGVSVLGAFPFSDVEISDILQHVEEQKKKIVWKTQNTPMQFHVSGTVFAVYEKLDQYYDDNHSSLIMLFDNREDADEFVDQHQQHSYYVAEQHIVTDTPTAKAVGFLDNLASSCPTPPRQSSALGIRAFLLAKKRN